MLGWDSRSWCQEIVTWITKPLLVTGDKVGDRNAEGTPLAHQPITGHSFEGLVRGSHNPPRVDSFFYHPTPKLWNTSQDRSECLKPQIVPELTWNSAFSFCIQTYDVFNLQIRHRERLAIMNSQIEQREGHRNESHMSACSVSLFLPILHCILCQEGTMYAGQTPDKGKPCLLLGTE